MLGFAFGEATAGSVLPAADVATGVGWSRAVPVNAVPGSGAALSYLGLGDTRGDGVIDADASRAPVDVLEFVASFAPCCPVSRCSLVDLCSVVGVAIKAVAAD